MLLVISPSKTQEMEVRSLERYTLPALLEQSEELVKGLSSLSQSELAQLMKISPKLAASTFDSFHRFALPFSPDNARQALLVFRGDQFDPIDVDHYGEKEFTFAQDHLRILSGLYGVLRPLDLIQPYRLEMATKPTTIKQKSLYGFWDRRITEQLRNVLAWQEEQTLINLASDEYFKAVQTQELGFPVLKISFKEVKNGKPRVIAIHAKRARGMMVDFVLRNRLTEPQELKEFGEAGYSFSKEFSTTEEWVFTRLQE